jgi:hypothetical protein
MTDRENEQNSLLAEQERINNACDAVGATLSALTRLSVELEQLVSTTSDPDLRAIDYQRLAEVTGELRDLRSALLGKREQAERLRDLLSHTP